jgi:MFS transporter, DHA3 family, macrolide efflux protein
VAETPTKPNSSAGAVLRQPTFRTMWIAQFVSVLGDFIAIFGVVSRITFVLKGSPSDVAFVVAAYSAPVAFVGPFAGVLVDRWNVKRVMIASDLIRALLAFSLIFAHTVPQIALVLAGIGFVSSFFAPAQSVTVRTVVPMQDLLAANALFAQAFYLVRIFSPAIAGAVVAAFGENVCFGFDGVSFAFSAAMIATLAILRPASAKRDGSARALLRDFAEGNRFIFTHRGLTFAFLGSAAAMFMLSSFSPLISVYVRDTLGAREMTYGLISAMVGVGLITGTTFVRKAAAQRKMETLVIAGLFGVGVGAALLGLFRFLATAALSTFTLGFAIAFVIVPGQTLSQKETPHDMMGRVSSTWMALFSAAQVLGMVLSGMLADVLGIRGLFLACAAAISLLAAFAWVFLRPKPATAAIEPAP